MLLVVERDTSKLENSKLFYVFCFSKSLDSTKRRIVCAENRGFWLQRLRAKQATMAEDRGIIVKVAADWRGEGPHIKWCVSRDTSNSHQPILSCG